MARGQHTKRVKRNAAHQNLAISAPSARLLPQLRSELTGLTAAQAQAALQDVEGRSLQVLVDQLPAMKVLVHVLADPHITNTDVRGILENLNKIAALMGRCPPERSSAVLALAEDALRMVAEMRPNMAASNAAIVGSLEKNIQAARLGTDPDRGCESLTNLWNCLNMDSYPEAIQQLAHAYRRAWVLESLALAYDLLPRIPGGQMPELRENLTLALNTHVIGTNTKLCDFNQLEFAELETTLELCLRLAQLDSASSLQAREALRRVAKAHDLPSNMFLSAVDAALAFSPERRLVLLEQAAGAPLCGEDEARWWTDHATVNDRRMIIRAGYRNDSVRETLMGILRTVDHPGRLWAQPGISTQDLFAHGNRLEIYIPASEQAMREIAALAKPYGALRRHLFEGRIGMTPMSSPYVEGQKIRAIGVDIQIPSGKQLNVRLHGNVPPELEQELQHHISESNGPFTGITKIIGPAMKNVMPLTSPGLGLGVECDHAAAAWKPDRHKSPERTGLALVCPTCDRRRLDWIGLHQLPANHPSSRHAATSPALRRTLAMRLTLAGHADAWELSVDALLERGRQVEGMRDPNTDPKPFVADPLAWNAAPRPAQDSPAPRRRLRA